MGKTRPRGKNSRLPFGVNVNHNFSIISANAAVSPQALLIVRKSPYI